METFGDQTTKTSEITSFPWLCSWRSVLSLPFPTGSIWAVPQLASRQQQWLSSISTLCNCTSACGQISPIPVLTTFSKVRSQQFREEGTLGTHSCESSSRLNATCDRVLGLPTREPLKKQPRRGKRSPNGNLICERLQQSMALTGSWYSSTPLSLFFVICPGWKEPAHFPSPGFVNCFQIQEVKSTHVQI